MQNKKGANRFFSAIIFLFAITQVTHAQALYSQKKIIDSSAYHNWSSVQCVISNDGKYTACTTSGNGKNEVALRSTENGQQLMLSIVGIGKFTQDSEGFVFRLPGDSLCIFHLRTLEKTYIPNVRSFDLLGTKYNERLIYMKRGIEKEFIIYSLNTGKEQRYENVITYKFNNQRSIVLLETEEKSGSNKIQILRWVDLFDDTEATIWKGIGANNYAFSDHDKALTFIAGSGKERSLWFFQLGMSNAKMLVGGTMAGLDINLTVNNKDPFFSKDGKRLFFELTEKEVMQPKPNAVKVDVWSYTDELQSAQMDHGQSIPRTYAAVFNIESDRLVRLQQEGESIEDGHNDEFAIVYSDKSDFDGSFYRQPYKPTAVSIVFNKDGSRKIIRDHIMWNPINKFIYSSPNGKWLVYYDVNQKAYISYEIKTGISRNITRSIPFSLSDFKNENYPTKNKYDPYTIGIAGWLENDQAILIYDQYDIWRVDPLATKPSVNITNAYGRKHNTILRLILQRLSTSLGRRCNIYLPADSIMVLSAFNELTKEDGFCKVSLDKSQSPELLGSGPWYMGGATGIGGNNISRALSAEMWILSRQSFDNAPNYYLTKDFKGYQQLSNVQPQQNYNWLTAELIHWKELDGGHGTGILYKPENFDPKNKYPVIFLYYERLSNTLHAYIKPQLSNSEINIPYYVSRGYIVCVPDITCKTTGYPGESAKNSVVSAANYLSKMPWVDAKRMGLSGHSFGGYETNYLITHSHLFAAAVEAAGPSDLISQYGGLYAVFSEHFMFETGQMKIGATLWERPDLYIKNSPIFKLDQVTTPLLMMHNYKDSRVEFSQGLELFTGLRRLGKPVWLLQYDDEDHSLANTNDQQDFTIRQQQFFDHYLKDAPAPKWMTQGIPARRKGIDDGLQLDTSVKK